MGRTATRGAKKAGEGQAGEGPHGPVAKEPRCAYSALTTFIGTPRNMAMSKVRRIGPFKFSSLAFIQSIGAALPPILHKASEL